VIYVKYSCSLMVVNTPETDDDAGENRTHDKDEDPKACEWVINPEHLLVWLHFSYRCRCL